MHLASVVQRSDWSLAAMLFLRFLTWRSRFAFGLLVSSVSYEQLHQSSKGVAARRFFLFFEPPSLHVLQLFFCPLAEHPFSFNSFPSFFEESLLSHSSIFAFFSCVPTRCDVCALGRDHQEDDSKRAQWASSASGAREQAY